MKLSVKMIGEGDWPEFKNLTRGNISILQYSDDSFQHNCLLCGAGLAATVFMPWNISHKRGCDFETAIIPQQVKDRQWKMSEELQREIAESNRRVIAKEKADAMEGL